jgi:Sap-like sulfolipid-1-addressing protein
VELHVLPLAITMMAGPGLMAAIVFVTHERAIAVSLPFVAGVLISTALFTGIAVLIAGLVGEKADLGSGDDRGSVGRIIQYVLVGLLVVASLRTYLRREKVEPPKWLGTLLAASPWKAFQTGLALIPLMPSDVVIMLTVGFHVEQNDLSYADALPFIVLTAVVAALPVLAYLVFRRRAERAMPGVREWMSKNSWLVNIIVYVVFIALLLT